MKNLVETHKTILAPEEILNISEFASVISVVPGALEVYSFPSIRSNYRIAYDSIVSIFNIGPESVTMEYRAYNLGLPNAKAKTVFYGSRQKINEARKKLPKPLGEGVSISPCRSRCEYVMTNEEEGFPEPSDFLKIANFIEGGKHVYSYINRNQGIGIAVYHVEPESATIKYFDKKLTRNMREFGYIVVYGPTLSLNKTKEKLLDAFLHKP